MRVKIPLLILSGEWQQVQLLRYTSSLASTDASATDPAILSQFIQTAFITGLTSFLLTLATFMQISVTSPTTHMIVTAARGVAQSALAVFFFHEQVTAGRVWSIVFILGGSTLYGWSKDQVRSGKVTADTKSGGYKPVPAGEQDVEMAEKR